MSIISDAAAWISELDVAAIPPRVQDKLRHQVLNMLAAALAGAGTGIGKRLSLAFPANGGDAWSLPGGGNTPGAGRRHGKLPHHDHGL